MYIIGGIDVGEFAAGSWWVGVLALVGASNSGNHRILYIHAQMIHLLLFKALPFGDLTMLVLEYACGFALAVL